MRIYCETLDKKKMPRLKALLARKRDGPPSLLEQRAVIDVIAGHYGLTVVKGKKKTDPDGK